MAVGMETSAATRCVYPPPVHPPSVHRIPVHPPSVRDGEYFTNNLRCWAHLHSILRPNPRRIPVQNSALQLCADAQSPQAHAQSPHRRYFTNNLRCWAHRGGEYLGTMLTHGVLTAGTSPTTYVVGLHCVAPSVKHHLIPVGT